MKSNRLFFFLGTFILVISCFFSCGQDQELTLRDAELIMDSLDFEFRLLNEEGVPSTIFKEGENFIFSFLIINKSAQRFAYLQGIDDRENFFRVDAINTDLSEVGNEVINLGKPWKTMFCEYKGALPISARDTLALEIPWNAQGLAPGDSYYSSLFCLLEDHPHLGIGNYKTGFSSTFSFVKDVNTYTTSELEFEIEFEIIK